MAIILVIFRVPILMLYGVYDQELMGYIKPYLYALVFIGTLYALSFIEASFYSNTDNVVLGTICAILPDTALYIPIASLLMIPMGINALWMAEFLANILFQFILFLIIFYKRGHFPKNIDDYMMLPADYYDDKTLLSISISNDINRASNIAGQVQNFLAGQGADKKKSYFAALAIEEMTTIIINDSIGKKVTTDIAVFTNGQRIKVALRDNGAECNYLLSSGEDAAAGIGIKLVRGIAKNVKYVRLADINMLNIEL